VTVTNFGNAPLRDVVILPRAGDTALPRQVVTDPIEPGTSATATLDLATVRTPGEVEVRATYRVAGRNGSASRAYDYRPGTGAIRLTGLNLTRTDDGTLRLSGNAGNPGTADVTGVVLAVGSTETVSPAYPQRDYFVGTVEGSEFAPFELTAEVDAANATRIPVSLTYRTAGETVTENVTLPYDRSLAPESRRGGSASVLPFGLVGAAAGTTVGLALLVPAIYLVRRRAGAGR
jgi:hypothetical protein